MEMEKFDARYLNVRLNLKPFLLREDAGQQVAAAEPGPSLVIVTMLLSSSAGNRQ